MVRQRATNEADTNDDLSESRQRGEEQDNQREGRAAPANLAASALRGLGQFFDMQAATARIVMRAQLRAASALGFPDYSRLLLIEDGRSLRLFSAMTENLTRFNHQAEETLNEVRTHYGRLFEKQMIDLTERTQHGLEELQQQAAESVEELKELSSQQADEVARATESLTDATRATLREGGEQFCATVRQGRELVSRQGETIRKEGERVANAGREALRDAGREATEASEERMERTEPRSEKTEPNARPSRSH